VNRLGIANERIRAVQKQQRNKSKKKMLENVLQRLELMQQVDYPGESPQVTSNFKTKDNDLLPALPMAMAKNASIKVSLFKPPDDPDFKDIYLNGHLIQTYKDIIKYIDLLPFEDAMERMKDIDSNLDYVPEQPDETFKAMVMEKRPKVEYYQSTLGDKLLHVRRVDALTYDVVE
jgi:hypothetical protein